MEEKRKKITMNNSGKTAENNRVMQYILGVPTTWANKIGITKDDREIIMTLDEKCGKITIRKANNESTSSEI